MDALLSSELSADTLAALQQHLTEQQTQEDKLDEDFGLSQFFYDEKTGMTLAKEAQDVSATGRIAFISTPAAFWYADLAKNDNVYLFEYDRRFANKYPSQYVYYDYNEPTRLPEKFHHFFDYIVVDPPYLNDDCLRKFADTMRWLAKDVEESIESPEKPRILTPCCFVTGRVMQASIHHELGFLPTDFEPSFQSKLSNQFCTYTNYTSKRFHHLKE